MKRTDCTVAALTNRGWQGNLGRMVSVVHSTAAEDLHFTSGIADGREFRHAWIGDADAPSASIYRPLPRKYHITAPSETRRESFRKTCRSDCE